MLNFEIGLSGLRVAQRAIEYIGTNIANASSEGYHRQELKISPRELGVAPNFGAPGTLLIGGVEITAAIRSMDQLLEHSIVRQNPLLGQVSQELSTLMLVQGAMGDLDTQGLTAAMSKFFNSMNELASQPSSQALQQQAVWAGDAMAGQFRNLADYLQDLDRQLVAEAQSVMDKVNALTAEIAKLNDEAGLATLRQNDANILLDRRDQAIKELSELVDVETNERGAQPGMVNVSIWGMPVVLNTQATELELGTVEGQKLGVSIKDASNFITDVEGGQLGGLLALKNSIIPDIRQDLDTLAAEIIDRINRYHVQGIGAAGSFTSLAGWSVGDETAALADLSDDISAGELFVRVIKTSTGQATVNRIDIADPATYTFGDLADDLDGLTGISASVSGLALHIEAESGYEFDFLPVSQADFGGGDWSGGNTAEISLSGVFSGESNGSYTVTVEGGGGVGVNEGLSLAVTDADGNLVKRFNVGLGYAAGDLLDLDNGLKLALSAGDLVEGDSFTLDARADSDTAGVLAALGINTLFAGNSAASIAVSKAILSDPARIATARGTDGADNLNALLMAGVGEESPDTLGGMTPQDYYGMMVTGVGQNISLREARKAALEDVSQQLVNQLDHVSGVDINAEAAKLVIFERMFQAAAKVMTTQARTLESLMELI
jgi:flagellar hook-associated protein FlgK